MTDRIETDNEYLKQLSLRNRQENAAVDHLGVTQSAPQTALSPEQTRAALAQAKETHLEITEWIKALDLKVPPILSASSAVVGGCLVLLSMNVWAPHAVAKLLLEVSLVPLAFSLLMGVSAVSPILRLSKWQFDRHRPSSTDGSPKSQTFFGQIALYKSAEEYSRAARDLFISEEKLLDNALQEIYITSKIAVAKSSDIAWSGHGLFAALVLLVFAGIAFMAKS